MQQLVEMYRHRCENCSASTSIWFSLFCPFRQLFGQVYQGQMVFSQVMSLLSWNVSKLVSTVIAATQKHTCLQHRSFSESWLSRNSPDVRASAKPFYVSMQCPAIYIILACPIDSCEAISLSDECCDFGAAIISCEGEGAGGNLTGKSRAGAMESSQHPQYSRTKKMTLQSSCRSYATH